VRPVAAPGRASRGAGDSARLPESCRKQLALQPDDSLESGGVSSAELVPFQPQQRERDQQVEQRVAT